MSNIFIKPTISRILWAEELALKQYKLVFFFFKKKGDLEQK